MEWESWEQENEVCRDSTTAVMQNDLVMDKEGDFRKHRTPAVIQWVAPLLQSHTHHACIRKS